jgi:hypothetical protein
VNAADVAATRTSTISGTANRDTGDVDSTRALTGRRRQQPGPSRDGSRYERYEAIRISATSARENSAGGS